MYHLSKLIVRSFTGTIRSINKSSFTEPLEGKLIGQENSILQDIMKDRQFKQLALIALDKLKKITDDNLLHLFTANYTDEDLDILQLLLSKAPSLLKSKDNLGMSAADVALINKQYNMLCMLLNNGSTLTRIDDNNTGLIAKAASNGIKIDPSDFRISFNCDKTDNNGNTIFHLMCKNKDADIFKYQDVLPKYQNVKNKEHKDIYDLAAAEDFIALLELLYPDQGQLYHKDGYHTLAKDQATKDLSQLLNKYGFEITIEEARTGINLYSKIDQKGNSVLQTLIKEYVVSHKDELSKDIDYILAYSNEFAKDYINYTARLDGNTPLHLAIRAGNKDIIEILYTNEGLKPLIRNSQNQTALDLAENNTDLVQYLKTATENCTNKSYNKTLLEITKLGNIFLDTNFANIDDFIVGNKSNDNIFQYINLLDEVVLTGEY